MQHKTTPAREAMSTFACAAIDLLQLKEPSKKRRLARMADDAASPTYVVMPATPATGATTTATTTTAATATTTTRSPADNDEGDAEVAAKKRLQYKMYQRRHRARQQEKTRLLEEQVAQLTQEIASLKMTREAATATAAAMAVATPAVSAFSTRHTLAGPPAQLVREYLRLFEHGHTPQRHAAQQAYVRSTMAPDVQGPQFCGADAVLEQWRLYGQVFVAVHLTVQDLSVTPLGEHDTLVTVSTTLRLRLRRVGLLSLFPSIKPRGGGAPTLLEKLVGSCLVVQGSLRFVVGPEDRVHWIGAEMDFADALTRLTGSFATTCLCLDGAQLDMSTGFIRTSSGRTAEGATSSTAEKDDATPSTSRLDLSFILSDV